MSAGSYKVLIDNLLIMYLPNMRFSDFIQSKVEVLRFTIYIFQGERQHQYYFIRLASNRGVHGSFIFYSIIRIIFPSIISYAYIYLQPSSTLENKNVSAFEKLKRNELSQKRSFPINFFITLGLVKIFPIFARSSLFKRWTWENRRRSSKFGESEGNARFYNTSYYKWIFSYWRNVK